MNGAFAVDRNIPINQQDFLHLAVKVGIPFSQIVANLVGLDFVLVEDAPYGALARSFIWIFSALDLFQGRNIQLVLRAIGNPLHPDQIVDRCDR